MKNTIMKIIFSSDNNFSAQLAVCLCSILVNSSSKDSFKFYVLDGGITTENKTKIEALKKIKDFEIEFIKINIDNFKDCPISKHFKLPTYFRLKLPSLLQENKVLYMDCDVIVKSSLSELFNMTIDNFYCACVEDFTSVFYSVKTHARDLGVSRYFNAGILLLNLAKIRDDNIEEKSFDFIKKSPEKIVNVDQCVLNAVFEEKVLFLDKCWNFQYNNSIKNIRFYFLKNYKKIKILHFACENKPWNFKNLHPSTLLWYHYLAKTEFKKPLQWVFVNIFKCFIKKINTTFIILKSIF